MTTKYNKILVKVINNTLALLLMISVLAAIVGVFFRISGSDLKIGNYRMFRIDSGSMEPAYNVGDYVVIYSPHDDANFALSQGDVIAFISDDLTIFGDTVIHRIIEIDSDDNIVTRGDANPVEDFYTVSPDSVIGRVEHKLSFLSTLETLTGNIYVFLGFIVLPVLLIFTNELTFLIITKKREHCIECILEDEGFDKDDKELIALVKQYGRQILTDIR